MASETSESGIFLFGEFRLDATKRLLIKDGEHVALMPKAFDTLLYLVRNANRVIEKDELMGQIWPDTIVEENNLNQNISILRRIFGEKRGEHRFIATIPGKGYKFGADVTTETYEESGVVENRVDQPKYSTREGLKRFSRGRLSTIVGIAVIAAAFLGIYFWLQRTGPNVADQPIKTIAVLPFKPLVPENRDEVLELGMADTLISRLGNYRDLTVFPLSSVRRYGSFDQNAIDAGKALGADSVLDGSIQRWGNKIRVNARLIKTSDGVTLWTGTFDEEFTDIFSVQDAISQKVVTSLALRLTAEEKARLERRSTSNPQAYELYLRGQYHYYKITPPEVLKAIELYKQAIESDPNYALAYAALADAYRTQAIAAHAPSNIVCPQAKALALRALEIDDSLAEAYVVLGWIAFQYEWDWNSAESYLKRAVELAPNNFETHRAYAHFLSNLGRHEEAIAEGEKARQLAPLTHIVSVLEGFFLLYGGHQTEAIDLLKKTIELDPNFWAAHSTLGRVYTVQGRYDEAIAEFLTAKGLAGGSTEPITQLGYAQARSGHRKEALETLNEMKSTAAKGYVPNYFFAVVYNGLGDDEHALEYLDHSFQEHEVQLGFIYIDSRWDNLRSNRRFADLISGMNLDR